MGIEDRLSFFAELYQVDKNPDLGMWLLYGTVVLLCIAAFQLGFAHKLPLLKTIIVYGVLLFGCTILTFLGTFLPIAEGLIVIVVVLLIYRIRKRFENKETAKMES